MLTRDLHPPMNYELMFNGVVSRRPWVAPPPVVEVRRVTRPPRPLEARHLERAYQAFYGQLATIYAVQTRSGLTYEQARRAIRGLVARGRVERLGARPRTKQHHYRPVVVAQRFRIRRAA